MSWSEIRARYPNQWLVIEAIEAHSIGRNRHLARISVMEFCLDGAEAISRYRQLHREFPARELYFVHTSRDQLTIQERWWLGIRV